MFACLQRPCRFCRHVALLVLKVRVFEMALAFCMSIPVSALLIFIVMKSKSDERPDDNSIPRDVLSNGSYSWLAGDRGDPTIMYAPNTSKVVRARMEIMKQYMKEHIPAVKVRGYASEGDLEKDYKQMQMAAHFGDVDNSMAVIFSGENDQSQSNDISYTLRPSSTDVSWNVNDNNNSIYWLKPHANEVYFRHSFLYMQMQVFRAIVSAWNKEAGAKLNNYSFYVQEASSVSRENNIEHKRLVEVIVIYKLCVMVTAAFYVYAFSSRTKARMKVLLRLNGCTGAEFWTSVFVAWFLGLLVYTVVIPLLLTTFFLRRSSRSLVCVICLIHGASHVIFTMLVCICFCRRVNRLLALLAVYLTPVFLGVYRGTYQAYADLHNTAVFVASSLFFEVAFRRIMLAAAELEFRGIGATWAQVVAPIWKDNHITILHGMFIKGLHVLMMLVLAWYVNKIGPLDGSSRKGVYPWTFIFKISYWWPGFSKLKTLRKQSMGVAAQMSATDLQKVTRRETDMRNTTMPKVFITELCKRFGDTLALSDACLKLYEGEIVVLVGHRDSGKSTLISLITGIIPPTSGKINVLGVDVHDRPSAVCHNIGVCPQRAALISRHTVKSHLTLFAKLRGMGVEDARTDAIALCQRLGLSNCLDVRAKELSPGDKKLLAVAIPFAGNTPIVLLDEPTADLDPDRKSRIWAFLKRERSKRAILVATSSHEEAEFLADRVALITKGIIKCRGSPNYIKKLFSAGYHLTLLKATGFDEVAVATALRNIIPSVRLEKNWGSEACYWVPEKDRHLVPTLMKYLKQHLQNLKVLDCDVDAITMDEVFTTLSIQDQETALFRSDDGSATAPGKPVYCPFGMELGYTPLTGASLWLSHFKAMFFKQTILSWRRRLVLFFLVIIPLLPGLIGVNIGHELEGLGRKNVTLALGDTSVKAYSVVGTCEGKVHELYSSQFLKGTTRAVSDVLTYFGDALEREGCWHYMQKHLIGADFRCLPNKKVRVTAYYNPKTHHTQPTSLNHALNAVAKAVMGNSTYRIRTAIHPLPAVLLRHNGDLVSHDMPYLFVLGISLMFGIMALQQVREATGGSKRLQIVCGVHPAVYWASSFAWDLGLYLVPVLSMLVALPGSMIMHYHSQSNWGVIFLLLFLYGWASIATVLAIPLCFRPATCGIVSVVLWTLTGLTVVLEAYPVSDPFSWLVKILLPQYCFVDGMEHIHKNTEARELCEQYLPKCQTEPGGLCCKGCTHAHCVRFEKYMLSLNSPGVLSHVLILCLQGIAAFLLTLALDWKSFYFRKRKKRTKEMEEECTFYPVPRDDDVKAEQERVAKERTSDDLIVLSYLGKQCRHRVVVSNTCVGISRGECFGILGEHGSGRTTLLRMLVGQVKPDTGDAYVDGMSVRKYPQQISDVISYCGPDDVIIPEMKTVEFLMMVARLRGVPSQNLSIVVYQLLEAVALEEDKTTLLRNFNRGNLRKVSLAIALTSPASILVLDNPTDGMDRESRRVVRQTLASVIQTGKTVILATNSLKECQDLSSRFAILVNGSFMCMGTPEHLKKKLGGGFYLLEIKMDGLTETAASAKPVVKYLSHMFKGCEGFVDTSGKIYCQGIESTVPAFFLFEVLESLKDIFGVADYMIFRASLERVAQASMKAQVPLSPEATRHGTSLLWVTLSRAESILSWWREFGMDSNARERARSRSRLSSLASNTLIQRARERGLSQCTNCPELSTDLL